MQLQPTPAQCYQVHHFFTVMSQNSSKFSHCVLLPTHNVSFDDFLPGFMIVNSSEFCSVKAFDFVPETIIEYQIVPMYRITTSTF